VATAPYSGPGSLQRWLEAARGELLGEGGHDVGQRAGAEVGSVAAADRHGARLLLASADVLEEAQEEVEAISLPGSLGEVEAFQVRARALFEETLRDLDAESSARS
jgi:hypothetical protein